MDFLLPITQPIAKLLGVRNLYAGFIILAVAIVLIAAITAITVCIVKAKKKKVAPSAPVETQAEVQPVVEQTLEQPVVEDVKEEPVVEQPTVEERTTVETKEEPVEKVDKEEKIMKTKQAKAKAPAKSNAKAQKAPVKEPEIAPTSVATKKQFVGKWVVECKSADEYLSKLLASNGEVMLSSEIYSSEEGARAGIETIIKSVDSGKFVIYQDKKKNYYYKLKTAGNRLMCVGEIYKSEEQCLKAVETVKRIASSAVVSAELITGAKYVEYTPVELSEIKTGLKGKWKIEAVAENKFCAKLYASNGQLMMSTEEVAQKKTALSAIESVKKNAAEGNFIIDRDKFGRFYYKLRNSQKSVICIGEAYDTLDACINALESVRRFAVNSVTLGE